MKNSEKRKAEKAPLRCHCLPPTTNSFRSAVLDLLSLRSWSLEQATLPDKKTECYMSLFVRTKCSNCQLYYPFMVMKPHFCVVNRDLCDISQALCAFSWSLSDRGPVPLIQCNPALRPPLFIRSLRYTATTFRPRETATHFLIKKTNVNTTNGHILTSQTSCNLTPLIRPLVRNLEN